MTGPRVWSRNYHTMKHLHGGIHRQCRTEALNPRRGLRNGAAVLVRPHFLPVGSGRKRSSAAAAFTDAEIGTLQEEDRCFDASPCSCTVGPSMSGENGHGSLARRKENLKNLWHELFRNPSQWWDYRPEKVSRMFPDFKHKETSAPLWIDGKLNPPWVKSNLAAMAAGAVEVNVFVWNKRLGRLTRTGKYKEAIDMFEALLRQGLNPDKFTFPPVLNACANLSLLEEGRRLHACAVSNGCESDLYVSTSLVDMYSKCGSFEDARVVFYKMPSRNVVAWTAMILGAVKCGLSHEALELSHKMQLEGVEPNPLAFVAMLNACAASSNLEYGRLLHSQIVKRGLLSHSLLGSSLVNMYVKCGRVEDAFSVFSRLSDPHKAAWSTMILGHARCGQGEKALELFHKMQFKRLELDPFTFVAVLNACASIGAGALDEGRRVHALVRGMLCESNVFVSQSLIDMYVKSGSIRDARTVFDRMLPARSPTLWNAMIHGYTRCREGRVALDLFWDMLELGIKPKPTTFVAVLAACPKCATLEEGRRVQHVVKQLRLDSNEFVWSGLVDMYAKFGSMEDAVKVFAAMPKRNLAAWSAMIAGYLKCGQAKEALDVYRQMQRNDVDPDAICLVGVVNACTGMEDLEEGRSVRRQIIQRGCEREALLRTCLMYAKRGSIDDAWKVFNRCSDRDLQVWNAMTRACVKCGYGLEALKLSHQMQAEGLEPNAATFVGMLNACASECALEEGKRIHREILQTSYEADPFVESSLIDMYCKCGDIEDALLVFDSIANPSGAAWSPIILGHVNSGQSLTAIRLFQRMCLDGIQPTHTHLWELSKRAQACLR